MDKNMCKKIDKDIDKLFDWLEIFGVFIFSAIIVFYIAFGISLLVQFPFWVVLNLDGINVLKNAVIAGFVTVVVIILAGIREGLR